MTVAEELLTVPAFKGLPDDQIAWFISQAQDQRFRAGEVLMSGGEPADSMFVLLEGQLQVRGEFGGETIILTIEPGQVTGRLPFSRMKTFTFGARALTDAHLLRFPEPKFHEL